MTKLPDGFYVIKGTIFYPWEWGQRGEEIAWQYLRDRGLVGKVVRDAPNVFFPLRMIDFEKERKTMTVASEAVSDNRMMWQKNCLEAQANWVLFFRSHRKTHETLRLEALAEGVDLIIQRHHLLIQRCNEAEAREIENLRPLVQCWLIHGGRTENISDTAVQDLIKEFQEDDSVLPVRKHDG